MVKYRLYNNRKLVTWSNKRCKVCGKFISKHSKIYCKIHGYLNKLKLNKKYYKKRYYNDEEYRKELIKRNSEIRRKSLIMQEYIKTRNFVYRRINKLKVGDIF